MLLLFNHAVSFAYGIMLGTRPNTIRVMCRKIGGVISRVSGMEKYLISANDVAYIRAKRANSIGYDKHVI